MILFPIILIFAYYIFSIVWKEIPNRGDRGDNLRNYDSPSLDKIIPSLGYAKGNIWVISYRANTIKNNCTFEEIQKLYEALLKLEVNS